MTFAMGRRFVIADGVERWKESDVDPVAAALACADPETLTVAFFAREEGRYKAPAKLRRRGQQGRRQGRRRDERQGQGAAELGRRAGQGRWHLGPRSQRGARADRPGRRPPAAAACASSRSSRSNTAAAPRSRRRRGRGVLRHVGRAQGLDARRRARRRRPQDRAGDCCSSCASRASASPASSTAWRASCARRRWSPTRSPPASPRRQAKKLLRGAALGGRRYDRGDRASATRRRSGAPWRRSPISRCESRGGELSEDTEAVRAVLIATR